MPDKLRNEGRDIKGETWYWFFCPGCECMHGICSPRWTFNGSMDAPTFAPSLLCNAHDPKSRCHSFIKNGKIEFLTDCHHKLAGRTVDIPDWEGWSQLAPPLVTG